MSEPSEKPVVPPAGAEDKPAPTPKKLEEIVVAAPEVYWCELCNPPKKFTDKKKYQDHQRYHKRNSDEKPVKKAKSVKVVPLNDKGKELLKSASDKGITVSTLEDMGGLVKFAKEKKEEAEKKQGDMLPLLVLGGFLVIAIGILANGVWKPQPSKAGNQSSSSSSVPMVQAPPRPW